MSRRQDPAMAGSEFPRLSNDAYHTIEAPMAIAALLDAVSLQGIVLEPAAGRGHLSAELKRYGIRVESSDLIRHPDPLVDDIRSNLDLANIRYLTRYDALVTNLPFKHQDMMLRRLLPVANRDGCLVAILARSTWCLPAKKRPLFLDHPYAAAVVHLPRRPIWVPKQPGDDSPRHEYSWFVWGAEPRVGPIATYAPKER